MIATASVWLLMYSLNGEPWIPYPRSREFYTEPECKAAMTMLVSKSRVIKKLRIKMKCQQLVEIQEHQDSA